MPSLTLPHRLIWFAHCPKAGGTSVERMMVALCADGVGHLHWGWDLWWRSGGWRWADPPCSPQHLIWVDAAPVLDRAPDAVFAVVRDPVDRMLSEWRWQRRHRRGTWLGRALAWLPFRLWLGLMLEIARLNPYAFDNHLRPQADFVPAGATVFRLEDGLEPVARWLAAAAGDAVIAPPHELRTQGTSRAVDRPSRAMIRAVFAIDYDRFGYDSDVPPAAAPPSPAVRALARVVAALDRRGRI